MGCEDLAIALTEAALEDGTEGEPALLLHVESCAACRDDLAALRRTARRVRAAPPGPALPRGAAAPHRALLVASIVGALVLSVTAPRLLAERAPPSTPAPAVRASEPAPAFRTSEPAEPAGADPRLLAPDEPALLASASASELALVAARIWESEETPVLGSPESPEMLVARLDGPAAERALARLAR
jgi:hypothetical protein